MTNSRPTELHLKGIISQLKKELNMVERAIETFEKLEAAISNNNPIPESGRKPMSEAGRQNVSEMKKRYWADWRQKKQVRNGRQ